VKSLFIAASLLALTSAVNAYEVDFNVGPPRKMTAEEQAAFKIKVRNNTIADILLAGRVCTNVSFAKPTIIKMKAEWGALDEATKAPILKQQTDFFNYKGKSGWCSLVAEVHGHQ
jgi:hypothetical protein